MQVPKKEIKDNILLAAKEEFIKNGFEKASIRAITVKTKRPKVMYITILGIKMRCSVQS